MNTRSDNALKIISRLEMKCVASCECMTKTPDPKYHKEDCLYRVLCDASAFIRNLIRGEELMDKFNLGWECTKSPTGYCIYDSDADPAHDSCIHCGDPQERK